MYHSEEMSMGKPSRNQHLLYVEKIHIYHSEEMCMCKPSGDQQLF